jgi:kynurenine formamidase
MKQSKKDLMTEILGFEPSRGQRIEILKTVKETGRSIEEITAERSMPEMGILDAEGKFSFNGEKVTTEEYHKRKPFNRLVLITRSSNRKSND